MARRRNPGRALQSFTGQLVPGANLANSGLTINPIAQGLLPYIPLPNLLGVQKNFYFVTSVNSDSDDLNLRLNHSFGAAPAPGQRGAGVRGGGGGGRGGSRAPRNNLSIGLHYHATASNETNPFPSVGGASQSPRFGRPDFLHPQRRQADQHRPRRVQHQPHPHPESLRFFAGHYRRPWHYRGFPEPLRLGPARSFVYAFRRLSDIAPSFNRNQTVTFGDSLVWNHGKHTWRWGGDFRRIELNSQADSNPRGSFVFTGENTAAFVNGQAVPNTGYDFADFLLGLPQQTSLGTALNPLTTIPITSAEIPGMRTHRMNGSCGAISPSISACARSTFLPLPKATIASPIWCSLLGFSIPCSAFPR